MNEDYFTDDSNSSSLPDFSFACYDSNVNNSSKTARSTIVTPVSVVDSPKKSNNNLNKINACKLKIEKFIEYEKNKKEIADIIEKNGFEFDEKGQIKKHTSEDVEMELDPCQNEIIARLEGTQDPIIPVQPDLDVLFSLENCSFKLYAYPLEAFNEFKIASESMIYYLNETIEPKKFVKFYNQIPNESIKHSFLDAFFLNIPYYFVQNQAIKMFELLFLILNNSASKWKLADSIVFEFLKSFGLNLSKLDEYFPNQFKYYINLNDLNEYKLTPIKIKPDEFELILSKLMELLIILFKKKGYLYTEEELDSIFFMFTYVAFDRTCSNFNLKLQLQFIFQSISDIYKHRCLWTSDKLINFDKRILNILKCELNTADETVKNKTNNSYHKMVNLNNYFKLSQNNYLRILASDLALNYLLNLLDYSYEELLSLSLSSNYDVLLEKLRQQCHQIFLNSSYSMFNLIEFLAVIIANLQFNLNDQSRIAEYINNFKQVILETNRLVKDQLDFQGRVQVKVYISNFLNKCEYYVSKLDQLPMKNLLHNYSLDSMNVSINTSFKRSRNEELENLN